MRKVANLGLRTAYNEKKGVHVFIKKLLALPYLPADHITPAFQHLLQSANSNQLQQLMTYLSNTWLHNAVWSIRQWSVYQQSVRTNNDVEGKLFYYLNKISCNISYKVCLLQLIYSIITVQTDLFFFIKINIYRYKCQIYIVINILHIIKIDYM